MSARETQHLDEGLRNLVGKWRPNDPSSNANTVFEVASVAGGTAVYSVYRVPLANGEYLSHALWAYDSAVGKVRVFEVKSTREVWYHEGHFTEDGALVLERTETNDPGRVAQRGKLRLLDRDTLIMESELYAEDGSTLSAVVEFKRRS